MKYDVLKEAIENINGSTFVGIDTVTEVKLKGGKGNPMQGRVVKYTQGANTMIFSNVSGSAYENMVKRRMEKEDKDPETFQVKARAWGTRIDGTPFIEHNDKYYLECIFISSGKSTYLLDGNPINKDEIEGLPEVKVSEESQGGITDKIIVRTFSLDSIKALRINGQVLTAE
jgi:hypothetical protein